jgi:uncharacterized protein YutE (UPF0331/DUF86 family)
MSLFQQTVSESVQFISSEIKEFDTDYAAKTWQDYQNDRKLQKLMDRTVENGLTALIEVCGTLTTEKGIGAESYGETMKNAAQLLGFSLEDQEKMAKLAIQRNRLAHRYLNFRWQAIRMFTDYKKLIVEMLERILVLEKAKEEAQNIIP